jgi:hypothetical protein
MSDIIPTIKLITASVMFRFFYFAWSKILIVQSHKSFNCLVYVLHHYTDVAKRILWCAYPARDMRAGFV